MEITVRSKVMIKGVPANNPNHRGVVEHVEGEYVFVSNMNMPYCGTMAYKKFHKDEVELIKPKGAI